MKFNKLLLILIACAIAFQFSLSEGYAAETYPASHQTITPGRNISEINLTWYTPEGSAVGQAQIALKSDMQGDAFPEDQAVTYQGTIAPAGAGYLTNKVSIFGLTETTDYIYRLGDGTNWSPVYHYSTRDSKEFGFIFVGDPQIGYADSNIEGAVWADTLQKASETFPEASFLMSVGDQVQRNKISLYRIFFNPPELRSLPVAPVQGNHDVGPYKYYEYHFNLPNQSQLGKTEDGGEDGDYYYTYGNTLFMFLNTNNQDLSQHTAFMEEAAAAYPAAKWKVLMFHHSMYSTASHSQKPHVAHMRAGLGPTIDALGVDLVLMGHDHVYVRTHPMKGDQPQFDQETDSEGNVVNPTGTVYITGNSSTGSKYYDIVSDPEFAAVNSQLKVPTFSYVHVNGNHLSFTSYRTDTMEVVDTYSILKTEFSLREQWDLEQFGDQADDPEVAGDLAAPAGDGVPNLLKYAFGIPALQPAGPERLPTVGRATSGEHTYPTISFRRRTSESSGIVYEVLGSEDLVAWSPLDLASYAVGTSEVPDDGFEITTVRGPSSVKDQDKYFLRINVLTEGE